MSVGFGICILTTFLRTMNAKIDPMTSVIKKWLLQQHSTLHTMSQHILQRLILHHNC